MAYTGSRRFLRAVRTSAADRPSILPSSSYNTSSLSLRTPPLSSINNSARSRYVSESSDSSVESGDDSLGQDDEVIPVQHFKKLLECPVCFECLKAPVHQCCEGHLLCKRCFRGRKITRCPICRGTLSESRNLAVESVLSVLRNSDNRKKTQIQTEPSPVLPPNDSLGSITKDELATIVSDCVRKEVDSSLSNLKEEVTCLESKLCDSFSRLEQKIGNLVKTHEQSNKVSSMISSKVTAQGQLIASAIGDMSSAICSQFSKERDIIEIISPQMEKANKKHNGNFVKVEKDMKILNQQVSLIVAMLSDSKTKLNNLGLEIKVEEAVIPNGHQENCDDIVKGENINGYVVQVENKEEEKVVLVSHKENLLGLNNEQVVKQEALSGSDSEEESEEEEESVTFQGYRKFFPEYILPETPKSSRDLSEPLQEQLEKISLKKVNSDFESEPTSRDHLHTVLSKIVSNLSKAIESRDSSDDKQNKRDENVAAETNDDDECNEIENDSGTPEPLEHADCVTAKNASRENTQPPDGSYKDVVTALIRAALNDQPGPSGYSTSLPEELPCPLHYKGNCVVYSTKLRDHLDHIGNFTPRSTQHGRFVYTSYSLTTRDNVLIVENLGRWFQIAYNQILRDDNELLAFLQVRLVSDKPDDEYAFYVDISLLNTERNGYYGSIQYKVVPFCNQALPHHLSNKEYLFHLRNDDLDVYRFRGGILHFQIDFLAVEKEQCDED
ncbi:breast cancer type 1 susceptibility protein homolog [Artemia franciscana]|uniref:RING-type domain-containing protein n=1 Tax=Artemia franciscana TaxID=6661 RepID=A0AA88HG79_ARTSF|nr:hypothetical protein QYM36_014788 [Artemia franciscana]